MDVEHRLKLFVGTFLDDAVPRVASVIHDDVDGAERGNRGIHEFLRKIRLRDITRQLFSPSARGSNGVARFGGGSGVKVVDHYLGPRGRELLRNGAPDAARPEPVTSAALDLRSICT